jgi:hypothetical protein
MDLNKSFNLTIFTDITKNVCLCSAVSISIIVLFIISPLSNFFKTSLFMKIVALVILCYTVYLNTKQTNLLSNAILSVNSENVKSQLNMNIICSYIFTLFIGLLIIFVIKSFF